MVLKVILEIHTFVSFYLVSHREAYSFTLPLLPIMMRWDIKATVPMTHRLEPIRIPDFFLFKRIFCCGTEKLNNMFVFLLVSILWLIVKRLVKDGWLTLPHFFINYLYLFIFYFLYKMISIGTCFYPWASKISFWFQRVFLFFSV